MFDLAMFLPWALLLSSDSIIKIAIKKQYSYIKFAVVIYMLSSASLPILLFSKDAFMSIKIFLLLNLAILPYWLFDFRLERKKQEVKNRSK